MMVFGLERVKARKQHKCTWCGQPIFKGEDYVKWNSVEDSWFTNKMHGDCLEALDEEIRAGGDCEYAPYDNERPAKLGEV
jgi:hypothetical protein